MIFALVHPANNIPEAFTTIRHGYKKDDFGLPSIKEVAEESDDEPVGYKRVTLVPPQINTNGNGNMTRAEGSPMAFNDPWAANRPSFNAERY